MFVLINHLKIKPMKKTALLLGLFIALFSNAQVDFEHHSELLLNAHRFLKKKAYEQALNNYENAFKINTANSSSQYLYASVCAAELGDSKTCEKWMTLAITKMKAPKETLVEFSKHKIYKNCMDKVLKNYKSLLNTYYDNLENSAAYFKIQKLLNRDVFTRKIDNYYMNISEKEQEEAFNKYLESQEKKDTVAEKKYQAILFPKINKTLKDYQLKIMRFADSLNIVELKKITTLYGWQKEAHLLLWHQRGSYGKNNWVWSYFKPLINNEIKQGKIAPSFWAVFEDFKSINETGKSIYGYHPGRVNSETVNEKRKSIGLPKLTKEEIEHRNNNPYGGRMF